jgi:integrase
MGRTGAQSSRGVDIRKNKTSESIQLTFFINGKRCRETLPLPPTTANLRYAADLVAEIRNKIAKATFIYSEYFPNSSTAQKTERTSSSAKLDDLLDQYLKDVDKQVKRNSLSPSTYLGYNKVVTGYLKPQFGRLRVTELTPAILRDWIKSLDLTAKTVKNIITPLRAVLDDAVNDEILESNPLNRIALTRLLTKTTKKSTYEIEPFTANEIHAILNVATNQTKNLFQFAFATGLRTSELIALRWSDIDIKTKLAHVQIAFVAKTEKTTKTRAGTRKVELNADALIAIERQRQWTALAGKQIFHLPKTNKPFESDKQIRETLWRPLLKLANVNYRNPYQTRHTFASVHLSNGKNPWWVAEQMGHEDVEMIFKHYGKWIPESGRKQAAQGI